MNIYQTIWSFLIYGFFGWCAEVAYAAVKQKKFVNRGFLYAPICPIYGFGAVSVVEILSGYQDNFWVLYVMATIVATLLEWVTGILLEKIFHHRWWDYSNEPFNIQGHICLPFSLAWGMACVIIVRYIHPVVLKVINWVPVTIGNVLLVILIVTLAVDLCVTVNGILNMNLKLKKMMEITEELQNLAEHLGTNISKNILSGMEKQESIKEKIEERKERYQELFSSISYTNRRLIAAFPRLQSLRYKKQLQELKDFLQKKKTGENK